MMNITISPTALPFMEFNGVIGEMAGRDEEFSV